MSSNSEIPSRKKQHVELCLNEDVNFREKRTGFDELELEYNALPEIDYADVDTTTRFLGLTLGMPLMVTGMTGGYEDAEHINAQLAEVCEIERLAIGVGSQRQARSDSRFHESYRIVQRVAATVPRLANIGASEVIAESDRDLLPRVIDLIGAHALAIHLNPLQELLQPEGTPQFRGVLAGIEQVVKMLDVPVLVKEVGAGLSAHVVRRLLDVGVSYIDVAGAGGTSWAGVELLRQQRPEFEELWDVGIPTVDCLRQVSTLHESYSFTLIASGGIRNGFDVAKSLALGAHLSGAARPLLQAIMHGGSDAARNLVQQWKAQLRASMFLSGSATIEELRRATLRVTNHARV